MSFCLVRGSGHPIEHDFFRQALNESSGKTRSPRRILAVAVAESSGTDPMLGGDHLAHFLANHNRWRIRVAGDPRRHDAGVCHAQPADSEYPQARIDNAADTTSRGWVIDG